MYTITNTNIARPKSPRVSDTSAVVMIRKEMTRSVEYVMPESLRLPLKPRLNVWHETAGVENLLQVSGHWIELEGLTAIGCRHDQVSEVDGDAVAFCESLVSIT